MQLPHHAGMQNLGVETMITPPPSVRSVLRSALLAPLIAAAVACSPTVKVEGPKEPITFNFNVNVNLDADIRVQLEEDAREDIEANPDIF